MFSCQFLSGELNWCNSVCLSASVFSGKIAGVCFGFELAFFLLDVFLVGSTNVLLEVSPNVSANLSKEIT